MIKGLRYFFDFVSKKLGYWQTLSIVKGEENSTCYAIVIINEDLGVGTENRFKFEPILIIPRTNFCMTLYEMTAFYDTAEY